MKLLSKFRMGSDQISSPYAGQDNHLFRTLIERASDGVIVVGPTGKIEYLNSSASQMFGYASGELLGQNIELLLPGRHKRSHVERRRQYETKPMARPMGPESRLTGQRKDGSEFAVDISLTPLQTAEGTITTAFVRDVTWARDLEIQQRLLADASAILAETLDYDERIRLLAKVVIPNFCDICIVRVFEGHHLVTRALAGVEPELHSLFLSNGDYSPCLADILGSGEALKMRKALLVEQVTDEILKETGNDTACLHLVRQLQMQSYITVPMLARGTDLGVITFIHRKPKKYLAHDLIFASLFADRASVNIDNARLYAEAQKAVRIREDVLSVVAHDLKNPLGVIKGFNQLLIEDAAEKSNNDHIATDAIARSVHHMERLIKDLLDFAKVQAGTLSIEKTPQDVADLVWRGVELAAHHAAKKDIVIHTEVDTNLPKLTCDGDRIVQLLSNLLDNAIKFSIAKQTVKLIVATNNEGVLFVIKDTGRGMSEQDLLNIFCRFWQARQTAKLGTGLGLSIAKGIVDSHGGKISVKSQLGTGTTVSFNIPHQ